MRLAAIFSRPCGRDGFLRHPVIRVLLMLHYLLLIVVIMPPERHGGAIICQTSPALYRGPPTEKGKLNEYRITADNADSSVKRTGRACALPPPTPVKISAGLTTRIGTAHKVPPFAVQSC